MFFLGEERCVKFFFWRVRGWVLFGRGMFFFGRGEVFFGGSFYWGEGVLFGVGGRERGEFFLEGEERRCGEVRGRGRLFLWGGVWGRKF